MKKSAINTTDQSFEEVYKTSYSHGLESIYRIETVDLKSVRKLGQKPETLPTILSKPTNVPVEELALDLGPALSGYLKAFVVNEPIQILKLSRHTEKSLLDEGMKTIGDLKRADLSNLVFVKGIGQGHVEEVRERLQEHTQNKPLDKSSSIDFGSWIRSLAGDLEAKLAFVMLDSYGLSELIPLTALESVELKKLTVERKKDLLHNIKHLMNRADKVSEVRGRLEEIEQVFVRPWIAARGGVATEDEIIERLERVSDNSLLAKAALKFIRDYYTEGFLFHLPGERGLYFSAVESWGRFKQIETLILSYLWNSSAEISYTTLYSWISRDLSLSWNFLEEKHFNKVVSLSTFLQRKKVLRGDLLIKRRNHYIREI